MPCPLVPEWYKIAGSGVEFGYFALGAGGRGFESRHPERGARVFTFADNLIEVPARKGMAGVDVITRSQTGGTRLFDAVHEVNQKAKYDRIIVITDEQATGPGVQFGNFYGARIHGERSSLPDPVGRGYMINVASAKNGVGYGRWTHLDGFSEAVIRFITEIESADGDRRAA